MTAKDKGTRKNTAACDAGGREKGKSRYRCAKVRGFSIMSEVRLGSDTRHDAS